MTAITPSKAAKAITVAIAAQRPVMLRGAPGVGKSSIFAQVAQKFGFQLRDVRATLLDPVDLRGVPVVETDPLTGARRTVWATPCFLPTDKDPPTIVLLDELPAASQSVQAACYQLLLDRALGEYTLPASCVVMAAGNRETDRAIVNRGGTALNSRLINLEVEPNIDDWTEWALSNGIATEVIQFIRFRGQALLDGFDPKSTEPAFPCPRTWAFVSQLLQQNPDKDIELDLYSGTVGAGAAAEFTGFLRVWRELTSVDALLLNPATAPISEDPATLYALSGALADRANPQNMDRIVAIAERIPPEFGVMIMIDAGRKTPAIQMTRPFTMWAAKNQGIITGSP